jgi:hypothetical protein
MKMKFRSIAWKCVTVNYYDSIQTKKDYFDLANQRENSGCPNAEMCIF